MLKLRSLIEHYKGNHSHAKDTDFEMWNYCVTGSARNTFTEDFKIFCVIQVSWKGYESTVIKCRCTSP